MMHCPHCGNQVPESAKFCGNCGEPVGGPVTAGARKEPPVVLYILIGILHAAACAIGWFVLQSRLESEPLHGVRLKKQAVWTDGGRTYTVTGLEFERSDDREKDKYPYVIGLSGGEGRLSELDCAAAVNGRQVDTRVDERGIRLARQHGSLNGGLGVIAEIDLILRDRTSGRCSDVIHLKTGKKKPDAVQDTGKVTLYEEDGILARYKTVYPMYSETGPGLEFYIENHTGSAVSVGVRDVAVKGVGVAGRMDEPFLAGTAGDAVMELDTAELEAKGVLPLRDVTLTLVVTDYATGQTLLAVPASIPSL